jgi:hypothetical protein
MSGGKLFLYGLMTGNLHIADTGLACPMRVIRV